MGVPGPVTTLDLAGSALGASAPTGTSIVGTLTDPAGPGTTVDDAVTDGLGHVTVNVAPSGTLPFFAVTYDGQGGDDARIGTRTRVWMKSQPSVTLSRSATRAQRAKRLTLPGSVSPKQTGTVLIQRYKSGRWATVATRTLSGSAAYSWTTTCSSTGTFKYRTVRNATTTSFAGTSATRTVKVV